MSNFKNVLKAYRLLRSLTDDETALLETLRSLSDTERELTVEALQEKPASKRAVKKAASKGTGKSRRATGMAAALNRSLESQRRVTSNGDNSGTCAFILNDTTGETCDAKPDDPIHDQAFGYGGYHPFTRLKNVVHEAGTGIQSAGMGPLP